jgi:hypothetical protein
MFFATFSIVWPFAFDTVLKEKQLEEAIEDMTK